MTNRLKLLQSEIINLYRDEKIPMKLVAKQVGVNLKSVIKVLKINSIEIRKSKKNRIGGKYGRLLVIRYTKDDLSGKPMWECLCDCGNKTEARGSDLETKKIKSCGCLKEETSKENIKIAHKMFPKSYGFCGAGDIPGGYLSGRKRAAQMKHREYSVSSSYLWELFLKQNKKCAMTGIELNFRTYWTNKKNKSGTASLDRIDSNKGYIEGNVQWVHKDINNMKQDYTVDEFKNYCKLVVKYNLS